MNKLTPMSDFILEKVEATYALAARQLDGATCVNGVVIYASDGREVGIPLDTRPFLHRRCLDRYPDMLKDTARLVGMRPEAFLTAVAMSNAGVLPLPFSGPRWFGFVMERLRRIRPNYVVVLSVMAAPDLVRADVHVEEIRVRANLVGLQNLEKAEENLMVWGANPVRMYARVAPIKRRRGRIWIGESRVRDSLRGGWAGGPLAEVYAPSES